jgi:hypothetical protein
MNLIYTYCITKGIEKNKVITECKSVSGMNLVEILSFDGIQSVYSLVSSSEFDKEAVKLQLENLEWVTEKAFAHEGIIVEIMQKFATLPMRFLTIYETKDNLLEFMKTYYSKILKNLEIAENNVEFGMKIYCNKEILKTSISEESEIKEERDIIALKPKGIAYMLNKKLDDKIETNIENNLNANVQDIYRRIKILSEEVKIKESDEDIVGSVERVANIALLINKDSQQKLISEIEILNEEYMNMGYHIEQTGPWPIYNFIEV